jgi:hypothetical protein
MYPLEELEIARGYPTIFALVPNQTTALNLETLNLFEKVVDIIDHPLATIAVDVAQD